MEQGFIKFNRHEDFEELVKYPNAFTLLALIAHRAKRTVSFSALGLEPGEALIGDYKTIGLTRQKYRTAKMQLENWDFITTKTTNRGTIAKLVKSTVFDINPEDGNHQNNQTATIKQPSSNH